MTTWSALLLLALLGLFILSLSEAAPREKRQAPGEQQQYQPLYQPRYQAQLYQTPYQQQQQQQQQLRQFLPQPQLQQFQPQQQQQQQPFQPPAQQQFQSPSSGFQCPSPNGQFAYPADCSKYYQCDSGQAKLMDCPDRLVFNPRGQQPQFGGQVVGNNSCDWPHNVPSCLSPNRQILKPEMASLCDNLPNGANPTQAFFVRHPRYCNVFFMCSLRYLHDKCLFCGEGTYFNTFARECRRIPVNTRDLTPFCGTNTQYVLHRDKTALAQNDPCWVYANRENPWRAGRLGVVGNRNNVQPFARAPVQQRQAFDLADTYNL